MSAGTSLTQLLAPSLVEFGHSIYLKRDDLLRIGGSDSPLQGNKCRKLLPNLAAARATGFTRILSFGGAYSNHLAALAAAGRVYDLETIGIVRGEPVDNPTLFRARADGMQLHFVSRTNYRRRGDIAYQRELLQGFGPAYLLPEGGANDLAMKGCREIVREVRAELPDGFDYLAVSIGTGGTFGGVLKETVIQPGGKVLGFPALKGNFWDTQLAPYINNSPTNRFQLYPHYHQGGFARWTPKLVDFIRRFYREEGILLDPLYTGKVMLGLYDLIIHGAFPSGSTIVAVHTGGLQGWGGFPEQFAAVRA